MIPPRRTRSYRLGGVAIPRALCAAVGSLPSLAASALRSLNPCPVCGRAAPGVVVCPPCTALLERALATALPHGDVLWLGPYAGPLQRMIHALKFGGQRSLAPHLGRLLALQVQRAGWRIDLVTSVPASAAKLRARGFDQAELLARSMAAEAAVVYQQLLVRTDGAKGRGSQVALGRDARTTNAAGAYAAHGARGLAVLLVDDVMTSGATLGACREALSTAGARAVHAAVVARTVRSENDLLEGDDDGGEDP